MKQIESREIENFYQVTDTIYRGAQPSSKGMLELKKLGIRTILSFRTDTDEDQERMGDANLTCLNLPVSWNPLRAPKDETVVKFLRTVTNATHHPVFVHCRQGVDRTGVMMAAYRIVIQGWNTEDAIEEMENVGSHSRYIKYEKYLRNLDVAKIRRELEKKD